MASQKYKIYNNFNKEKLKINDAIKVTTLPQLESFWVEVNKIENNIIYGSIQNELIKPHGFNYLDTIKVSKKHIKELKKEEDRNNVNLLPKNFLNDMNQFIISFREINKRDPTFKEFEIYKNVKYTEIN